MYLDEDNKVGDFLNSTIHAIIYAVTKHLFTAREINPVYRFTNGEVLFGFIPFHCLHAASK